MSTTPTFNFYRVLPRDAAYLDRRSGNKGEIFYDFDNQTLRIFDGTRQGGFSFITENNIRQELVVADIAKVIFDFTVVAPQIGNSGNKYQVDGEYWPELTMVVGYTYVFDQSDLTNVFFPNPNNSTVNPHPVNFSADNANGALGGGTAYVDNVVYRLNGKSVSRSRYNGVEFNTSTSRQVWITVTNDTPSTLYYHCYYHVNMGSSISISNPGTGSSGIGDLQAGTGISIAISDGTATISNSGVIDIEAGSGISLVVNQGVYTINSTASAGDLEFSGNTITSSDSSAITFIPAVNFESDVVIGNELVFPDGSRQITATLQGPEGPEGPPGAGGAGTGDVSSVLGGYVNNAIVRYSGTSGNNIKNSTASINDAGVITASGFSGSGTTLTNLDADNLSSGTLPNARFPATLPALSGANLTSLNATNLGSGTVPVLRLGTAGTRDATTFLRGDNTWAVVAGGGGASDSFSTIAVAGQSSVVADSSTDTLTLVAGTGITITTNAGTDTITITNSGNASDSFTTIAVAGQSNVVADSATDTLTLAAGTGISITTNDSTDTVTITSTVSAGVTAFTGLSDSAGTTVDTIYMPAITMLSVTNQGASAYRFDQYGTTDNPTVYALNGATIAFKLSVSGHPFLIQTGAGANYSTGLIHVSTTGVVSTGSSAQGQTSGTLYWKIPDSISGGYRYQCSAHVGMVGSISIKNFASI